MVIRFAPNKNNEKFVEQRVSFFCMQWRILQPNLT